MICFCKPPSLHQSVLQSRPDSNLRWRKLPVAGHRSHASLATFLWLTKEGLWLRPSARRWVPIRALSCRPQARALGGTGAFRLPDRTSAHTCAPIVAALVCLVCLRSHLRLAPPRPRPHPARRAHLRHDRVEATENRCAGPRLGTAHQGRDASACPYADEFALAHARIRAAPRWRRRTRTLPANKKGTLHKLKSPHTRGDCAPSSRSGHDTGSWPGQNTA